MELATLLILGIADYSISRLFAKERGPFDLIRNFRALCQKKDNWLAEGVACIPCLSFYFGFILAALVASNIIYFILYALGARGIAIFIGRFLGDIH